MSPLQPYFPSEVENKAVYQPRTELKEAVTTPFIYVLDTTTFAVATTQSKKKLASLFKEGGGTIFIMDSENSCTLPKRDKSYST